MKKFLIIDDHEVVRSGIKTLLSDIYKESEVDEANNGITALENIRNTNYDLAMLDIKMPNTDTLALMETIRNDFPDLKVLVFSMSPENLYAQRYLKAGARGFLNKDSSMEEIHKAIEQILSGKKYISDNLVELLASTVGKNPDENKFNLLSPREFEIATLLLSGQTISQMSKDLHLGVSTVGTHKARIFEKLGVTNLLELKEIADHYNFGG
ncbi:MAG: response regulator transcription factor [Ferruginibacter sp.]